MHERTAKESPSGPAIQAILAWPRLVDEGQRIVTDTRRPAGYTVLWELSRQGTLPVAPCGDVLAHICRAGNTGYAVAGNAALIQAMMSISNAAGKPLHWHIRCVANRDGRFWPVALFPKE